MGDELGIGIGGLGAAARAGDLRIEAAAAEAQRAAGSGRAEEASKAFEELLARMLVKELRRGLPNGFFGGGAGADVYESWLDEHLGAALTRDDSLGLAGMVKAGLELRSEVDVDADTDAGEER